MRTRSGYLTVGSERLIQKYRKEKCSTVSILQTSWISPTSHTRDICLISQVENNRKLIILNTVVLSTMTYASIVGRRTCQIHNTQRLNRQLRNRAPVENLKIFGTEFIFITYFYLLQFLRPCVFSSRYSSIIQNEQIKLLFIHIYSLCFLCQLQLLYTTRECLQ